MQRTEYEDKDTIKHLDKVNNERLETTRKRVAHAIRILSPVTWLTYETIEKQKELKTDIAHATNLLESAAEEMRWHCEWFGYDDDVVMRFDDACTRLGTAMAEFFNDELDIIETVECVKEALVFLARALATLIRWNDDDVDVSEV